MLVGVNSKGIDLFDYSRNQFVYDLEVPCPDKFDTSSPLYNPKTMNLTLLISFNKLSANIGHALLFMNIVLYFRVFLEMEKPIKYLQFIY